MDAISLLPPGAAATGAAVLDQCTAFAVVISECKHEAVAE